MPSSAAMPSDAHAALTRLMRQEGGRVLALLAARFGLDLADEAVQDAYTEAARTWPDRGVPDNPPAWLMSVARRRAIDRIRRAASADRRTMEVAPELLAVNDQGERMVDEISQETPTGDEHLRLVLLCCHPALDRDTQVALTLRLVGGLTTPEIASAFLVPEATLAQRIVRAKRKIRDARIPLVIPASLDGRIDALLGVLYLIFNEGYLTRGTSDGLVRVDLFDEAIRLTRVVDDLLPSHAEIEGLLALELYHRARVEARVDHRGDLVLLEDQDRSTWDQSLIGEANAVLNRAIGRMDPGPHQVQAVIAGHHANATSAARTDWPAIEGLYRQLMAMTTSPVVAVNHAVAVAMADGPRRGLVLLEQIDGLEQYHLFHAARGELLLRGGDPAAARESFLVARDLTDNPAELRHLDRRLDAC